MARIVITGGAGFLGRRLIDTILAQGQITLPGGRIIADLKILCLDIGAGRPAALPESVAYRQVAIEDAAGLREALGTGIDAVFHLAAVVSSAAEADFDLGMRVNLDGTRILLEALRALGGFVPMITTSSIATAGHNGAPPASSYGAQKAIAELLAYDFRRRGLVDARTLRLPTIVVRPGNPNAAASSFASGIIREPVNGVPSVCPVSPDLAMWVASPDAAVAGLIHALSVAAADWPAEPAVNLPGLTVRVEDMVRTLGQVVGEAAAALVSWQHDPDIDRIVASWPSGLDVAKAQTLGFLSDASYQAIVRSFVKEAGVA